MSSSTTSSDSSSETTDGWHTFEDLKDNHDDLDRIKGDGDDPESAAGTIWGAIQKLNAQVTTYTGQVERRTQLERYEYHLKECAEEFESLTEGASDSSSGSDRQLLIESVAIHRAVLAGATDADRFIVHAFPFIQISFTDASRPYYDTNLEELRHFLSWDVSQSVNDKLLEYSIFRGAKQDPYEIARSEEEDLELVQRCEQLALLEDGRLRPFDEIANLVRRKANFQIFLDRFTITASEDNCGDFETFKKSEEYCLPWEIRAIGLAVRNDIENNAVFYQVSSGDCAAQPGYGEDDGEDDDYETQLRYAKSQNHFREAKNCYTAADLKPFQEALMLNIHRKFFDLDTALAEIDRSTLVDGVELTGKALETWREKERKKVRAIDTKMPAGHSARKLNADGTTFAMEFDPLNPSLSRFVSGRGQAVDLDNSTYKLFNCIVSRPTMDKMPPEQDSMSDYLVFRVLHMAWIQSWIKPADLHKYWPTTFNHEGLPLSQRKQHGLPAIGWCDLDQKWYYIVVRGVYTLFGGDEFHRQYSGSDDYNRERYGRSYSFNRHKDTDAPEHDPTHYGTYSKERSETKSKARAPLLAFDRSLTVNKSISYNYPIDPARISEAFEEYLNSRHSSIHHEALESWDRYMHEQAPGNPLRVQRDYLITCGNFHKNVTATSNLAEPIWDLQCTSAADRTCDIRIVRGYGDDARKYDPIGCCVDLENWAPAVSSSDPEDDQPQGHDASAPEGDSARQDGLDEISPQGGDTSTAEGDLANQDGLNEISPQGGNAPKAGGEEAPQGVLPQRNDEVSMAGGETGDRIGKVSTAPGHTPLKRKGGFKIPNAKRLKAPSGDPLSSPSGQNRPDSPFSGKKGGLKPDSVTSAATDKTVSTSEVSTSEAVGRQGDLITPSNIPLTFAQQVQDLQRDVDASNARLVSAQAELEKSTEARSEEQFSTLRHDGIQTAPDHDELVRLREDLATTKKRLVDSHGLKTGLEQSLVKAQADCEASNKTCQTLQDQLDGLQKKLRGIEQELYDSKSRLEAAELKLKDVQAKLVTTEKEHEKILEDHDDTMSLLAEARTTIANSKTEHQERTRELEELQNDSNTSKERLASLQKQNKDLQCILVTAEGDLRVAKDNLKEATARADGLVASDELAKWQARVEALKRELANVQVQRDQARQALNQLVGSTQAIGQIGILNSMHGATHLAQADRIDQMSARHAQEMRDLSDEHRTVAQSLATGGENARSLTLAALIHTANSVPFPVPQYAFEPEDVEDLVGALDSTERQQWRAQMPPRASSSLGRILTNLGIENVTEPSDEVREITAQIEDNLTLGDGSQDGEEGTEGPEKTEDMKDMEHTEETGDQDEIEDLDEMEDLDES